MRKVKEFWELIDVLKAQGYEWERKGFRNNKLYPSLFASRMFELCGDYDDGSFSWHDDWLQPKENKDIGKFCKFWDTDEEPDNKLASFSFLRSDKGEAALLRWATSMGDSYSHYRVVDVDIK